MTSPDPTAIDAWLRTLTNEGTRRSFAYALDLWREYLDGLGRDLLAPERSDVEAWRDRLLETVSARTGRKLTGKTVDSRLVAVRSFYDFLAQEGEIQANPIRHVRLLNGQADRSTPTLSDDEMERLAAAADGLDPARRLFVAVHATTCCRVSEALNIRVGDIRCEGGEWAVWLTRSGQQDPVPLDPQVRKAIEEHVSSLSLNQDDLLFSRPGWPPMTYSSARFTYQILGVKAGLCVEARKTKRGKAVLKSIVTPHMLRVSGMALLLDRGAPLERVQRMAGHKRAESTLRTRRPSMIDKRDAMLDALEQAARAALGRGDHAVEVDPADLLRAIATLDSYRDMAGLARPKPRIEAAS